MKKWNSWITASVISLAAAFILAGCGGGHSLMNLKGSDYVTLGNYKGLEVTIEDTTISDGDVKEKVMEDLESLSADEEVDRNAEEGDTVNIDYVGKKDGVAFDGGTAQGYNLVLGSGTFIDGFEEGLIGHGAGETVVLNLTFPENYGSEELAGQDVTFDVTVNKVLSRKAPDLNDETANRLQPSANTVDEYMAMVREQLQEEKVSSALETAKNSLFQTAMENSEIVSGDRLPSWLIEQSADKYRESIESSIEAYGYSLTDFLKSQGMSQEQYESQVRAYAENVSRVQLFVIALSQEEGIEVDLEKEYGNYAARYGYSSAEEMKKSIKENNSEDSFRYMLLAERVEEFLLENAHITNPENAAWQQQIPGDSRE